MVLALYIGQQNWLCGSACEGLLWAHRQRSVGSQVGGTASSTRSCWSSLHFAAPAGICRCALGACKAGLSFCTTILLVYVSDNQAPWPLCAGVLQGPLGALQGLGQVGLPAGERGLTAHGHVNERCFLDSWSQSRRDGGSGCHGLCHCFAILWLPASSWQLRTGAKGDAQAASAM